VNEIRDEPLFRSGNNHHHTAKIFTADNISFLQFYALDLLLILIHCRKSKVVIRIKIGFPKAVSIVEPEFARQQYA
jgi:hypothetical protein